MYSKIKKFKDKYQLLLLALIESPRFSMWLFALHGMQSLWFVMQQKLHSIHYVGTATGILMSPDLPILVLHMKFLLAL